MNHAATDDPTSRAGLTGRLWIVAGCALYLAVAHWIYVHATAPSFGYLGFTYVPPTPMVQWLFLGMALAPATVMPSRLNRPSQLVAWLLYLTVFMPSCFIPSYTTSTPIHGLLVFNLVLTACILALIVCARLQLPSMRRPRVSRQTLTLGMLAVSVLGNAYLVSRTGLRTSLPSLWDIYEVRFGYRDIVVQSGALFGYIALFQLTAINPFMIATGLVWQRRWMVAYGIFGQVFLYSFTGFKAALLTPLLLFALDRVLRPGGMRATLRLVWGAIPVALVPVVLDRLFDTVLFNAIMMMRLVFTNGLNSGFYYDFFAYNERIYFSQSLIGRVTGMDYPYDVPYNFLIGQYYFDNDQMSANVNLWADGYANLGLIGMVLVTLVLGGVLAVVDGLVTATDRRLAMLLVVVPAISLANGSLLTTLLSQGLAAAAILVWIIPTEDAREKVKARPSLADASSSPRAAPAMADAAASRRPNWPRVAGMTSPSE